MLEPSGTSCCCWCCIQMVNTWSVMPNWVILTVQQGTLGVIRGGGRREKSTRYDGIKPNKPNILGQDEERKGVSQEESKQ